jgi:hypothetical protein
LKTDGSNSPRMHWLGTPLLSGHLDRGHGGSARQIKTIIVLAPRDGQNIATQSCRARQ